MLSFKKSSDPDFLNSTIRTSLNRIEKEQVEQRKDLSVLNVLIHTLINHAKLQKQVDEFFEDKKDIPDSEQDLD